MGGTTGRGTSSRTTRGDLHHTVDPHGRHRAVPAGGHRLLVDLPDDVLTDRARDGDTGAFEVLARRYQQPMFALAARITSSRTEGEDVVQTALTTAWRRLPTFRGDARFSTWLYRIVTNESLTARRRQRPLDPWPDPDVAPASGPEDRPDVWAQRTALAHALAAALAGLPTDLRVAWLLRETEHCSYEQIASIVGVGTSTVRGRISRARAKLARALEDWR